MAREQDFISEVRTLAQRFWKTLADLKAMQRESIALDYTNTLADGEGDNDGITKAEVIAVLHTSTDAIDTEFTGGGHATNFSKLL